MSKHRITLSGTILGQKCQNVIHVNNPDGALNNTAIKNEINSNFVTPLRNVQNAGALWTQMAIADADPASGVPEEIFIIGGAGSLAGAPALPFVAGVFSIRTGTGGRHGHGRFYLWGVHGASIANGAFETNAYNSYVTNANGITARFKTGGTGPLTMGVMPRGQPENFIPMTNLVVRSIFGVQRRRNYGVGS